MRSNRIIYVKTYGHTFGKKKRAQIIKIIKKEQKSINALILEYKILNKPLKPLVDHYIENEKILDYFNESLQKNNVSTEKLITKRKKDLLKENKQ